MLSEYFRWREGMGLNTREHRRLAAIFVLDVFGFSRMMSSDESGTLARVLKQRRDLIEPQIAEHEGRVVKLMGDGVLAEFPSVTEAVNCAVAIQAGVSRGVEADAADADPILLRIGINLGEVIVDDGDIYGDGVNVAARLEGLAQPGGIALSGAAYDQLRGREGYGFRALGPHQVKNIPNSVPVYHLDADTVVSGRSGARAPRRRSRRGRVAAALVAVAILAGAAWWGWGEMGPEAPPVSDPLARMDAGLPSVVVLPFDDLSDAERKSYFGDGITDSVITDLTHVSGLLVIARNTSFAMRGQVQDIPSVARDLGVRYVVTGSVQRSEDKLRINARLTDADSGYQLWAEKFDRDMADFFAVQDEVTAQIISALEVELSDGESQMVAMQDTRSLDAYDQFMQARGLRPTASAAPGAVRTRGIPWPGAGSEQAADAALDRALALDPGFAQAQALRIADDLDIADLALGATRSAVGQAGRAAGEMIAAGHALPQLHSIVALDQLFAGDVEAALASARRAVEEAPNLADGYAVLAWVLNFSGQRAEAQRALAFALRLNPVAPAFYHIVRAEIALADKQDATAADAAAEALALVPNSARALMIRAAALARQGDFAEATRVLAVLSRQEPDLSLAQVAGGAPYARETDRDNLAQALRLAGLPG